MPITVKCECGNTYELKDQFSGKSVKCPKCGAVRIAPVAATAQADPAFARDKFLLRQKAMAIKEKYYVWDEAGNVILYVERPTFLLRGLLALFGGLVSAIVVGVGLGTAASALGEGVLSDILALLAVVGFVVTLLAVMIVLSPKRHVTFYRDDTKRDKLMEVLQDSKVQILSATYTILDHRSLILARLNKNHLYNLFRKRWDCFAPNGTTLICVAREDSIVLSLLRRVLGPFFGLLRTNFIILGGSSQEVVGEFNRKMTLLDRYVLDMARDPGRRLDRRTLLALGVMLDTGERR